MSGLHGGVWLAQRVAQTSAVVPWAAGHPWNVVWGCFMDSLLISAQPIAGTSAGWQPSTLVMLSDTLDAVCLLSCPELVPATLG